MQRRQHDNPLYARAPHAGHFLATPLPAYASKARAVEGFYRASEATDGTWKCSRGLTFIACHATLDDALAHLFKLAAEDETPSYIYAHWPNGEVG